MRKCFLIGLVFVLFLTSCGDNKVERSDAVVASVYGKVLYKSDLESIMYEGITTNDSIVRVKAFIDAWIRRELLIRKAETTLEKEELDFSKQIEDYRNSLVIYTYETEMLRDNLDTVISDDEIERYYNENVSNFRLDHNIVKVIFLEFPKNNKWKWTFYNLLSNPDTVMFDSINNLALRYSDVYESNLDSWRRFDDVVASYNLDVNDELSFLKNNNFVMRENRDRTSMLRICEVRVIGDFSPLEFEKKGISYIILNARKKEFLEKLHNDLYDDAMKNRIFEIY